ncbi:MAG TPA: hypothetical protein VFX49_11765 [Chloroflexota bacterium]|nr:hypothetical protein [Chloroflexota bacterium]
MAQQTILICDGCGHRGEEPGGGTEPPEFFAVSVNRLHFDVCASCFDSMPATELMRKHIDAKKARQAAAEQ